MKKIILPLTIISAFLYSSSTYGQGCVAIRGNAAGDGNFGSTINLTKGEFYTQFGYRHFKSFRHFRGDIEEANRVADGTEVINHSNFFDFSLSYGITNRVYVSSTVPFVHHTRSSIYEHGGNSLGERHETSSHGISDIRLEVGYWLFDPSKKDFNYSVGIGVKLPTGKYDYTDTFYNQGPNKDQDLEKVVDQSIQPGDGGTGLVLNIQGYQPLSENIGLSTNLYYLFNYKETNGVLTRRGSSEFSCPDQFAARIGAYYNTMMGFSAYVGGRVEGVPSTDIIGGSAGYRRPGYVVSAEPGVAFSKNQFSVSVSVPIALYRNRIQSYSDKQRTEQTGVFTNGDAAFADYLVNLGFSYRFGGSNKKLKSIPKLDNVILEGN